MNEDLKVACIVMLEGGSSLTIADDYDWLSTEWEAAKRNQSDEVIPVRTWWYVDRESQVVDAVVDPHSIAAIIKNN